MKIKLFFIFCLGWLLLCGQASMAQMSKKEAKHRADSLQKIVKKKRADSLHVIKVYKHSRHYKDSVARASRTRKATVRAQKQAFSDSVKAAEEAKELAGKVLSKADSIKLAKKKRTEKAEKDKKYKKSKRYADSVEIVKRTKSDNVKNKLLTHKDSVSNERKKVAEATKNARKHTTDSIKAVRTRYTDSVKRVRARKAEALAKQRNKKISDVKTAEKKSEEKKKFALEIKIKQKREAFSNKNMLKKHWSLFRRFTQNSFTHYNYYYNAKLKMEEAEANMLRNMRKESYDSIIPLYPFNPNKDSSLLATDMDSIIRKASVGIQIHDPRVKWANDMFLIMGKAYYYKGQYANAAATFKYIISNDQDLKKTPITKGKSTPPVKKKPAGKGQPSVVEQEHRGLALFKHKSVHNDALLWLARTYTQCNQTENSGAIVALIEADPKMPESVQGKVAEEKAFAYLAATNYNAALPHLETIVDDNSMPNWLRTRAAFIAGQIHQNNGQYLLAAQHFERCLDFFPKIEMDFYARKYVAYNTLHAGKDVGTGIGPLKRVLNDNKYNAYHDQVYYVLGMLAFKAGKPTDAIPYLQKSIATPKATKKQKALSYAALGDVYYSMAEYGNAKTAYDSAIKHAGTAMATDSAIVQAIARSSGLAEIAYPSATIAEQDSLLALAALSKKEQLRAVKDYIKYLEKKQRDSIENAKLAAAAGEDTNADAGGGAGSPSNWYFANKTLMQQGMADFKKKWGNRPLADNWRRGVGVVTSAGGGSTTSSDAPDTAAATENNIPTEVSLLALIPNTDAQKQEANVKIQKAYITLAKGYYARLNDYPKTIKTLDTLVSRYPRHPYREDELYLRYKIAFNNNELDKAKAYSASLLAEFPTSDHANSLKPKTDESTAGNVVNGVPVAAYYEQTYNAILAHQYREALQKIDTGLRVYQNPQFAKKFAIAQALCYGGMAQYDKADTLIAKFLLANASDSLAAWANYVSAYLKDVRAHGGIPSWYNDKAYDNMYNVLKEKPKPPVDTSKPKPLPKPKPVRPADVPSVYNYQPDEHHFAMLLLPGLDSRTAPLKQAVFAHNRSIGMATDSSAIANVLIDLFSTDNATLLIKDFDNADAAQSYIDSLKSEPIFAKFAEGEIRFFTISTPNHKKLLYDKKLSQYISFYNANYRK